MLVDNLSLGSQKKGFVGDRWIKMDIGMTGLGTSKLEFQSTHLDVLKIGSSGGKDLKCRNMCSRLLSSKSILY